MTAARSGALGIGQLNFEGFEVLKDVGNRSEFQQLLFLDSDAEAGVSFDQDFVETK